MVTVASSCPYLAGCHPHAHAWLHHTAGKAGGGLGVMLFLVLIAWLYSLTLKDG